MKKRPSGDKQGNVGARERAMDSRESTVAERESVMSSREHTASEREELLRACEEANLARAEAEAKAEHLMKVMRDANENMVHVTLLAEDLAEQAEAARAEVAASEELFRSLVTTSAAIVFRADPRGNVRVDEVSWPAFTGLRVKPTDGASWLEGIHPEDRDRVHEAWMRAVTARTVYTHQHRLRRKDRSYAWVVARAVPIPVGGEVREWIGMMTDISDRIRVEEAREQFIAVLGHDLRNPVNAILMAADALLRAELGEKPTIAVKRITRSAHRIEAMIRDVLDFARGRLGSGIPIKPTHTDLARICGDAVDELRHAHPARRIVCSAIGDATGMWDEDRMEQMLSNLIGNAVQHGTDPIEVTVRGQEDEVVVSIHNEGEPIPPEVIPKLFEPFRRREGDYGHGLGLGLYIVSEIVRAHGGSITVTSTRSEGTSFTTRLPRDPARKAETSPLPIERPASLSPHPS